MKTLIVEDDLISRKLMVKYLTQYSKCDVAVNGEEALQYFNMALNEGQLYDLITLDIMMPKMDGQQVLKEIRRIESEKGILGGMIA
jgi:two-component system chemotaxis response regulator CheY